MQVIALAMLVALAASPSAGVPERTTGAVEGGAVLVLELRADTPVADGRSLRDLSQMLATEIGVRRGFSATTPADLKALLEYRSTQDLLGCEDQTACLAELSESAGARYVLTGSVGEIGSAQLLTLSLIDARTATALRRLSESVDSGSPLAELIPGMVDGLLGEVTKLPTYSLPQDVAVSFAVLDMKASGVEADLASNLAQIVAVTIKGIDRTSVISRDDIVAMLELEQQKQAVGCEEDSCIAELAGALGVDKMVVGQVGKVADSFVLTLRLIDSRAARVDSRVTETFSGAPEQLIVATRIATLRLLGIDLPPNGRLVVTADQDGSMVWLDGKEAGELPLEPLAQLLPGRHNVRLTKAGFFDWRSDIYVKPGDTTVVWSEMKTRPARWYQKWWVWAAVGGGVALGVTAAIIATRSEPTSANGRVVIP